MIKFIVAGEPVPYVRMTQGQVKLMRIPHNKILAGSMKIRDRILRYFKWKEWVAANAYLAMPYYDRSPKKKTFVDLMIYFPKLTHRGDMDNYYKGILDAMFDNDKNVCGCMDWDYDKDNPRCEIEIYQ